MNRLMSSWTRAAARATSLRRVLVPLVLAMAGLTLLPVAAEAETTLVFPAEVPVGTSSDPLPASRAQTISEPGIFDIGGVVDTQDNCPDLASGDQADNDGGGLSDACDPDDDNDGFLDHVDSCPTTPSGDQADTDGDGIGDACDETSGVSAGRVTGGGWVNASRSSFGFNAQRNPSGTSPTGVVTYQDKLAGVRIKSTSITAVVITGTSATIIGRAEVNGLAVDLRVEITDLGEPGSSDSFEIFAGSYASGGILDGGNIQIHS